MASEVIEQLQRSDDVVERELGEALVAWQDDKAQRGLSRHLGYEPKDIREQGAIAVIEARVLKGASGFEEIDDHHSYEAIVDRHPERFRDDVVNAARRRLQFGKEGSTIITSEDIRLIASSRRQKDFSEKWVTHARRGAHAVIPPRKNAKPWKTITAGAVARNDPLRASKYLGRVLWRRWSGYHGLGRVETKMHCVKLLGQRLMTRDYDLQVAELQVRIAVLNGYTASSQLPPGSKAVIFGRR